MATEQTSQPGLKSTRSGWLTWIQKVIPFLCHYRGDFNVSGPVLPALKLKPNLKYKLLTVLSTHIVLSTTLCLYLDSGRDKLFNGVIFV